MLDEVAKLPNNKQNVSSTMF